MNMTATLERPTEEQWLRHPREPGKNPWVSDHVLLNLSMWWVRATRPETDDFASEVGVVFSSLQRDLQ